MEAWVRSRESGFGDAFWLVSCNTFFRKTSNQLVIYSSGGCSSAIDLLMVWEVDRTRLVKNFKVA